MLSGEFSVETLCTVLGLSRTAYYRYKRGGPASGQSYQLTGPKQDKKQLIERVFGEHKRRYGSRRIVTVRRCGRTPRARPQGRAPTSTNADENVWFTGNSTAAADRLSRLCHARLIADMVKGIGQTYCWISPCLLPLIRFGSVTSLTCPWSTENGLI